MSLTEEQRVEVEVRVNRMVNYWLKKCPPHVDRDDAMSAAWEGVCKAAGRYSPDYGATFATYACIVARGHMLDWFRKEYVISRTTPLIRKSVEWNEELPQNHVPEDSHGTELDEHLLVRLQDMPQRTQAMFLNYFWEGHTQKEIAEEFECSEARVNQIFHAAYLKLRKPNYELRRHRNG